MFLSGHVISRWEGLVFLGCYAAYPACLVLDASGHDALPAFGAVMGWFVIPISVLTPGVASVRAWRRQKREASN